jgi:glycosyltransferase involved in cell wall biosynthesis
MLLSGVYFLAADPLVCAVADNFLNVAASHASSANCRVHFLAFPMWYAGDFTGALSAVRKKWKASAHRISWMCNAPKELRWLRLLGQKAIFCHQNLFCNEELFAPQDVDVCFDAIYTSRLDEYKRIWLAAGISKLMIITANPDRSDRLKEWGCAHAVFNKSFLGYDEVSARISGARVGLALSKKEGGMFATTEYLLCGKPVVSTPSLGGRDFWFEPNNHLIAAATPEDVASKVAYAATVKWDTNEIRQKAISRMKEQRSILRDYVNSVSREGCLAADSDVMSGEWLRRQFVPRRNLTQFFANHSTPKPLGPPNNEVD